jgi:hypothetical protein
MGHVFFPDEYELKKDDDGLTSELFFKRRHHRHRPGRDGSVLQETKVQLIALL